MALGELLLAKNVIIEAQLQRVLSQQKIAGGRFGDNVIALGYITREKLEGILQEPPPVPTTIQETGLESNFVLNLLLRLMYISGIQTIPELSEHIKLTRRVVESTLTFAKNEALVEIRGPSENNYTIMRYALTNAGRRRAAEVLRRCEYIGPAPVPLESYQIQVQKQTITNEIISIERLQKALSHLVLPPDLIRKLGPAANSGRAILVFGGTAKHRLQKPWLPLFNNPFIFLIASKRTGKSSSFLIPRFTSRLTPSLRSPTAMHIPCYCLKWNMTRDGYAVAGPISFPAEN